MNGEPIIDVRGLTKRFNGRTVVDHVDLTVQRGEIVGFLGPNGSGKTTTIRMICGLLKPDAGSGTCLGYDILTEADRIKLEVGYMTQRFSFYEDLTIRENLDFVARLYDLKPRQRYVADTLDQLGLTNRQRPARRDAVRRVEAAPGARRLRHAPAATAPPRRADGRRRSEGAARILGRDPRTRRRRG